MRAERVPEIGVVPAAAAWLLEGAAGRKPPADDGTAQSLVEYLTERRLAAEAAASPRLAAADLPAGARRSLALERERTAVGAPVREAAMRRAGERLEHAGLRSLLYKGTAVIRLTHGDPSRRPMADVDLIAAPGERAAVRTALVQGGLLDTGHGTPLHDVLRDERGRGAGHPLGVVFEIHEDVFPPPHPFAIDIAGVFMRAAPSDLDGLLLPSPEDAFVLSALQLVLHETDGRKVLQCLRDLALLARVASPRGSTLEGARVRSEEWGLGDVVAAAGRRAGAWAGAPPWPSGSGERLPRASRRRTLALGLALAEMDEAVIQTRPPRPRVLTKRLAAALWHARASDSAMALWRGLLGAPGERSLRRSARLVARAARALGGSRGSPGGDER